MNGIILFVSPNFNTTVTATFIRSYSSLLDLVNSFKHVINCRLHTTEKYNINRKLLALNDLCAFINYRVLAQ